MKGCGLWATWNKQSITSGDMWTFTIRLFFHSAYLLEAPPSRRSWQALSVCPFKLLCEPPRSTSLQVETLVHLYWLSVLLQWIFFVSLKLESFTKKIWRSFTNFRKRLDKYTLHSALLQHLQIISFWRRFRFWSKFNSFARKVVFSSRLSSRIKAFCLFWGILFRLAHILSPMLEGAPVLFPPISKARQAYMFKMRLR